MTTRNKLLILSLTGFALLVLNMFLEIGLLLQLGRALVILAGIGAGYYLWHHPQASKQGRIAGWMTGIYSLFLLAGIAAAHIWTIGEETGQFFELFLLLWIITTVTLALRGEKQGALFIPLLLGISAAAFLLARILST